MHVKKKYELAPSDKGKVVWAELQVVEVKMRDFRLIQRLGEVDLGGGAG